MYVIVVCCQVLVLNIVAGKELLARIVFGKKLYLNVSDLAGYWRSIFKCCALAGITGVVGRKYFSLSQLGIEPRSLDLQASTLPHHCQSQLLSQGSRSVLVYT